MGDLIQRIVDRFLMWELPRDLNPDGGISFKPPPIGPGNPWWPVGTNLLTAVQATAMVKHMLDGLAVTDGWRPIAEAPIKPFADTPAYYRYSCLIQSSKGVVFGGYGRWQNVTKRGINGAIVEVRWYADHADRWIRDPMYFMPLPEPRKD